MAFYDVIFIKAGLWTDFCVGFLTFLLLWVGEILRPSKLEWHGVPLKWDGHTAWRWVVSVG